jgi:Ca2+-dependent lipid-binding protein
LKDADMLGKQDPFIKFKYANKYIETDVKDGAGKNAVFNEKFSLNNIQAQIEAGKKLILEAYDKDVASSDWLGSTSQISYSPLI